jgi:hypothetical protein
MPNSPVATRSKVTAGKERAAADKSSAPTDRPPSSSSASSTSKGGDGWPTDKGLLKEFVVELLSDDAFLDGLAERVADKLKDRLEERITARVLDVCEPRIAALEMKIESLAAEIGAVREESAARSRIYVSKLDAQEQYQRRNNIRIFGVPEQSGESVTGVVTGLCRDKLDVQVDPSLIDRCHRVGRLPTGPASDGTRRRPRAILVKFISYQTRRSVLTARKRLKGTGITIGEDLTQRRYSAFREIAGRVGINHVWTIDGRILWREGDRIHSRSDV